MARQRLTVRVTNPMRVTLNQYYPDPYTDSRTHVIEGEFDFEVEDLDSYVQVQTASYSRLTYRDPSGTLAEGDRVLVPVGYNNKERLGRVIALGRGSYAGATKDVAARVVTEELTA